MASRELDSYHGPAVFVMADGDRVNVHCYYRVSQEMLEVGSGEYLEGLTSWRGDFTADRPVLEPGMVKIELPDGRSGTILVAEVHVSAQTSGTFTGSGAPPE